MLMMLANVCCFHVLYNEVLVFQKRDEPHVLDFWSTSQNKCNSKFKVNFSANELISKKSNVGISSC